MSISRYCEIHLFLVKNCDSKPKISQKKTFQILSFVFNSNVSEPVRGRPSNNACEIKAATRAINDAGKKGHTNIRVITDSQAVTKGASELSKWKQNGWRKSNGQPVVNRREYKDMDRAIRKNPNTRVEFEHIPAHSGNQGNEAADRLAKRGAQKNRRVNTKHRN